MLKELKQAIKESWTFYKEIKRVKKLGTGIQELCIFLEKKNAISLKNIKDKNHVYELVKNEINRELYNEQEKEKNERIDFLLQNLDLIVKLKNGEEVTETELLERQKSFKERRAKNGRTLHLQS